MWKSHLFCISLGLLYTISTKESKGSGAYVNCIMEFREFIRDKVRRKSGQMLGTLQNKTDDFGLIAWL